MSTDNSLSAPEPTPAPDFSLADHLGSTYRLADHLGRGPVLVVFYRGHWCPYCRRYLGKLRDHWPRLSERGAQLVAISPEPTATSQLFAEDLSLPFPLLSDPDGTVIDRYGTRNSFRSPRAVLPHPSVFLVDAYGFIRHRSIDRNYKKRTTVRTILGWLDELSSPAHAAQTSPPLGISVLE